MGIFSKKKKDEFLLELEESSKSPDIFDEDKSLQPDYIAESEDILSGFGENTESETGLSGQKNSNAEIINDPLEAMRQRMMKNAAQGKNAEVKTRNTYVSAKPQDGKKTDNVTFREKANPEVRTKKENKTVIPKTETEEKPSENKENAENIKDGNTLLERCMAYLVDEDGNDATVSKKPLYKLESVADILKSDSERSLEALSAKYDIKFEDIANKPSAVKEGDKKDDRITTDRKNGKSEKNADREEIRINTEKAHQDEIFNEILAGLGTDEDVFKNNSLPNISDIDNAVIPREKSESPDTGTATIKFTPVKSDSGSGDRMSISTSTRAIDLSDEFKEIPQADLSGNEDGHLEMNDFEEFNSKYEYEQPSDGKAVLRRLSVKKRNAFLQLLASAASVLILSVFALPAVGDFILKNISLGMTVCTAVLGVEFLCNIDMFASFAKIVSRRSNPDCLAALSALSCIALGSAAAYYRENEYYALLLGAVILLFRSISKFYEIASRHGNLKQIIVARPKKAVTLLTDEATTFAMAKNAIDGDALIAIPKETSMVRDFMKYSEYDTPLGSRMRIVTIAAAVIAAALGFAATSYFNSVVEGLYVASIILCIAAFPTLFFINSLPVFKASVRLNKKGSMIAGISAARHLELANAVVMNSRELFPDGTVTMQNMKVLADNNVDEVFVRAASLTEAVNSPLTAIFKRIAGTNKAYKVPDSDTVKYEDKMGISGWVEDELMFIGNRTLMQAHGIAVPDIEVDRKILREGYFPVYIATGGKACAMIIVQYRVDRKIAEELNKITDLGVTVLVDNCDPNLTDEMICDYFALYEDSVKSMSNSGVHMYRNAAVPTDSCSAPAAFRGNPLNLISIINCASRVKHSNTILTVIYIIAAIMGVIAFAYATFSGIKMPPSGSTVLLTELCVTFISYLLFLIKKP